MKKLPVLILAYNRPDLVAQVMQVIQTYQPPRLYLACDGPRPQKLGDVERVAETQQVMKQAVNWECETHCLFREQNLGCAQGVYEAISWFFDQEEYGVIIEDDVIVSQDFFRFCEDLLPRYKDEERIMQITSRNTSGRKDIPDSYVYSQTFHCWGWASWRRAWKYMDMQMSGLDTISIHYLVKRLGVFRGIMMWKNFSRMKANLEKSTSWATRWYLSILCHDGLVVCPGANLGINIGLEGGEHFSSNDKKRPSASVELRELVRPIRYNDSLAIDARQKRCDSRFFLRNRWAGVRIKMAKLLGK